MAIPFPSSPFTGEYFTYGPQTYVWNGFKWIIYISPDGTITESGNTKDSFYQININNTKQFDSFNNRTINFQGINLSIYSGGVNTLVFSAQPQTNSSSTFTGGTVSGATNFTSGLTANTIYATTYQNLPSSTFSGGTVSGATNFTGGLTANTISATTYQNLTLPVIYKSTADGTGITGVASEQISSSQLIPANTFKTGDIIRITWRVVKSGTASAITCKLYVNTSVSLVGALQVGQVLPGFTNSNSNGFQRHLVIKSATDTQNIGIPSLFTDFNTIGSGSATSNINWTVDQYIIFMTQLQSAQADVVRTSFYLIEKL